MAGLLPQPFCAFSLSVPNHISGTGKVDDGGSLLIRLNLRFLETWRRDPDLPHFDVPYDRANNIARARAISGVTPSIACQWSAPIMNFHATNTQPSYSTQHSYYSVLFGGSHDSILGRVVL